MKAFTSRFAISQAPSTILNVRLFELCDAINDAKAKGESDAALKRESHWILRELEGRKRQILERACYVYSY